MRIPSGKREIFISHLFPTVFRFEFHEGVSAKLSCTIRSAIYVYMFLDKHKNRRLFADFIYIWDCPLKVPQVVVVVYKADNVASNCLWLLAATIIEQGRGGGRERGTVERADNAPRRVLNCIINLSFFSRSSRHVLFIFGPTPDKDIVALWTPTPQPLLLFLQFSW